MSEAAGFPYRRIVDDLRQEILAGRRAPGERLPSEHEVRLLDLAPGVPVVRILRTMYDSGDRPVEVQDSVVAADRHEFRYEVQIR